MSTIHLTTDRLIIRSPVIADAPAINAAIHASAAALRSWMPWAQTLPTPGQSHDNLLEAIALGAAGREFRLLLFSHAGELVGSSGLHEVDWRVAKAEIGYWADQRFTGQGLISEGVAAITAHAHRAMGLRRVEILVSERNERSWRIPERLGFALEGTLRHHRVNPDGRSDHTRIYASLCLQPQAVEPWLRFIAAAAAPPEA